MTDLAPRSEADFGSPAPKRTITAERYVSTSYMDAEWQQMWPHVWLFAGLRSDVAEPGEYFVHNIGRESILVSCDNNSEIHAFYNVCQHRGARLMVNDRGWVRDFVCPYHGWTYKHSGELTVVPQEHRFAGGVPCDERSLQPIRCEVWEGMVWVCMDDDAPSLHEYLGALVDLIEPYRVDAMTLIEDQTVRLNCNYKAVFDNFGELYHVEHIHPQHASHFDCPRAEIGLFKLGHTGVVIDGFTVNSTLDVPESPPKSWSPTLRQLGLDPDDYHGRVLDVRMNVQRQRRELGAALGFDFDMLSDERLSDIEQYNVFPNTMLTIQPENLIIMRARPDPVDPNWCWWDKMTFAMIPDPAVAERAGVSYAPRQEPENTRRAAPNAMNSINSTSSRAASP